MSAMKHEEIAALRREMVEVEARERAQSLGRGLHPLVAQRLLDEIERLQAGAVQVPETARGAAVTTLRGRLQQEADAAAKALGVPAPSVEWGPSMWSDVRPSESLDASDQVHRSGSVLSVDLWYPGIDAHATVIEVGLVDVRSARDIRIAFDFERNGWTISQDFDASEHGNAEDWREVVFLPETPAVESLGTVAPGEVLVLRMSGDAEEHLDLVRATLGPHVGTVVLVPPGWSREQIDAEAVRAVREEGRQAGYAEALQKHVAERNAVYSSSELGAVADELDEENSATAAKKVRAAIMMIEAARSFDFGEQGECYRRDDQEGDVWEVRNGRETWWVTGREAAFAALGVTRKDDAS